MYSYMHSVIAVRNNERSTKTPNRHWLRGMKGFMQKKNSPLTCPSAECRVICGRLSTAASFRCTNFGETRGLWGGGLTQ